MFLIKYLLLIVLFIQLGGFAAPKKPFFTDGETVIYAKNGSKRVAQEFAKLEQKNPCLRKIMIDMAHFIKKEFKKDMTVVMFYRTQKEQDYIYRNSKRYKRRKFISPHQIWHAADIRSFTFKRNEIDKIVDYVNKKYDSSNHYTKTAMYHKVYNGVMHFHIQFIKSKSVTSTNSCSSMP